jgi:exosome complex component CSL4
MSEKMTMPGDEIATSEEYMPGNGTYEMQGKIFAAIVGKIEFSESDKTVHVKEAKRSRTLKPGDIVLGEVGNVTNSLANISISGLENLDRSIGAGETGVIHISKVTESYTEDVRKEYRSGDLVRAKVLQVVPSLQLSSREPELGVLKGRCGRCRTVLTNNSGKLYCDECEKFEHRKLASDFGKFTPESKDVGNRG